MTPDRSVAEDAAQRTDRRLEDLRLPTAGVPPWSAPGRSYGSESGNTTTAGIAAVSLDHVEAIEEFVADEDEAMLLIPGSVTGEWDAGRTSPNVRTIQRGGLPPTAGRAAPCGT